MTEPIPSVRREVNLNIAHVAAKFSTPGLFEFLCECGRADCQLYVAMSLDSFSARQEPVLAQAHQAA
jgi:hypothetical protein